MCWCRRWAKCSRSKIYNRSRTHLHALSISLEFLLLNQRFLTAICHLYIVFMSFKSDTDRDFCSLFVHSPSPVSSIKMFLRCRPHHDHKSLEMCFWTRWSSIRLPTHTGNLIYRGWNETLQWFSITNSYTAPTKHLSIEWTLFCVRWVVNVYPSLIALMARYSHIIKGSCWAWKR